VRRLFEISRLDHLLTDRALASSFTKSANEPQAIVG
jgi:hypothetical protein